MKIIADTAALIPLAEGASQGNMPGNPERFHILISKTLAGLLRDLAKKAVALKEQELSMANIIAELRRCIESSGILGHPGGLHVSHAQRPGAQNPLDVTHPVLQPVGL